MQTVAAIRYVTTGLYSQVIEDMLSQEVPVECETYVTRLRAMAEKFNASIAQVKEAQESTEDAQAKNDIHDLCARHLYEMAGDIIMSLLLMQNAQKAPELFGKSLQVYVNLAEAEVEKHNALVMRMTKDSIDSYRQA